MKETFRQVIQITDSKDPGLVEIQSGLEAFNRKFTQASQYEPLNLSIQDSQGKVIAGLLGGTHWSWLHIDSLWVAENHRGQGLEQELLRTAEQKAMARGCTHAHLDTHDFQAPGFYQKNGYEIQGSLENLPQGFKRYLMKKKLIKK